MKNSCKSKVSVVIPTFNRASYVLEALKSVLDQNYQDYDVWIIDDGSTDETAEMLRPFLNDRLHYVCQENGGASKARNSGIRLSGGEYIAFLDSDDLAEPDRLCDQVTFLELSADVGVVFSDVLKVFPDGVTRWFSDTVPGFLAFCHAHRKNRYVVIPARDMYRFLLEGNPVKPSSLMVRRQCFERGLAFDESLRVSEGFDLVLQLARQEQFGYIAKPLVRFRVWKGSIHVQQIKRSYESAIKVLERNIQSVPLDWIEHRSARRGIAVQHWMMGRYLWNNGEQASATCTFLRAFKNYPDPMFLLYAVGSLLPRSLVSLLKADGCGFLMRLRKELFWWTTPCNNWLRLAENHRWVFVAGCNRSGKTMLSNLFGNHPDVSVIPNGNSHTRALPNSESERCRHIWSEKIERFRLTEEDNLAAAPRLVFDWLHYSRWPRRIILVESDLPAIQMRWLQKVFRNSYFIGVVRNGYAVAEAIRLKEGYSIERCARQWNVANKVMLKDATFVQNFRMMRYEDFVANPMRFVEELATFVGIDTAPLRPFVMNGWRLGNTDSSPSKLRNANSELIEQLSSDDIEDISATASEMLAYLGYFLPEKTYACDERA